MSDRDNKQQSQKSETSGYQTTFDPETGTVSEELVAAISAYEGCHPLEVPVLANHIDPDALNSLFRAESDCTVQFEYADYDVTVDADGTILVRLSDDP